MPAQMGLLRPLAGTFVSDDYADFDADLLAQMQALRSRSQTIVAFAQEGSLVADGLTTSALVDAVGTLDVPLLILASAEIDVPEGQAFYDSLRALHDTYPQSTLITIPDARHYAIVTHADVLKEHVLDWMDAQWRIRDKTDRQISLADGRMLGYSEHGDLDEMPGSLWHGEADWSIPVMMGRYVAGKIPYCQRSFYENEGRISLIKKYRDEIINALMT